MGIVSTLVIITVVIAFSYGYHPFGKNEDQTAAALANINAEDQINASAVVAPKPTWKRALEPKLSKIIPEPTSEPDPKVAELIDEAAALVDGKPAQICEARDRLNETLSMPMNNVQRAVIKRKLSELAGRWLFGRGVFPQDRLCGDYKVKPGDQLGAIGKQHRVPWEILMEVNKIGRPELLKAGETIKIIHGPFHVRVYRSTFTMDLYLQHTFVRSFPVGLGGPGRETPTGLWRVKPGGKLISPTWTDPDTHKTYKAGDPDYPLGSRWIGLEGISGEAKGRRGFAIHGTKKPEEIGTAVRLGTPYGGSRGCIRLYNGDAILVYNLLTPGLSRVEVVE